MLNRSYEAIFPVNLQNKLLKIHVSHNGAEISQTYAAKLTLPNTKKLF